MHAACASYETEHGEWETSDTCARLEEAIGLRGRDARGAEGGVLFLLIAQDPNSLCGNNSGWGEEDDTSNRSH